MDREFVDVIYVFVNAELPGIKFYDNSPVGAVAAFAGSLTSGVFETVRTSIEAVTWDEEVNRKNGQKLIHYEDGDQVARTYMVSPEKFEEILNHIQKNKDTSVIRIDIRELNKFKDAGYSSKNETVSPNNFYIEQLNQFEGTDYNNKRI